MANLKNTIIQGNDNIPMPSGTSSDRPSSPSTGMIRFNTDLQEVELYDGNNWINPNNGFPVDLGSSSDNPAEHAALIRKARPNAQDGYYYIKNGSVTDLVYCDLSRGGWMYLIPPADASTVLPIGVSKTQTANQPNCANDTIRSTDNWFYHRGYRCGTAEMTYNLNWPNNIGATKVQFAAVTGGGLVDDLSMNGIPIGPLQVADTSDTNRYYTGTTVSTCTGNVCWENDSLIDSLQPMEFDFQGNLNIRIFLDQACQPSCSYGVSYSILRVAVK